MLSKAPSIPHIRTNARDRGRVLRLKKLHVSSLRGAHLGADSEQTLSAFTQIHRKPRAWVGCTKGSPAEWWTSMNPIQPLSSFASLSPLLAMQSCRLVDIYDL